MSRAVMMDRVIKREMYGSRSPAAVITELVLFLLFGAIAAGAITLLAQQTQPQVAMDEILRAVAGNQYLWLVGVGGLLLLLLGTALIIKAFARGRRARHMLPDERAVVVVENAVIASALVREASLVTRMDPDQSVATVDARKAVVKVKPVAGTELDLASVNGALNEKLTGFGLQPGMRLLTKRVGREARDE